MPYFDEGILSFDEANQDAPFKLILDECVALNPEIPNFQDVPSFMKYVHSCYKLTYDDVQNAYLPSYHISN